MTSRLSTIFILLYSLASSFVVSANALGISLRLKDGSFVEGNDTVFEASIFNIDVANNQCVLSCIFSWEIGTTSVATLNVSGNSIDHAGLSGTLYAGRIGILSYVMSETTSLKNVTSVLVLKNIQLTDDGMSISVSGEGITSNNLTIAVTTTTTTATTTTTTTGTTASASSTDAIHFSSYFLWKYCIIFCIVFTAT